MLTKEDHRARFAKSLEDGGRFRSRISTGMKWPKDIYARRYSLIVQDLGDDAVTFSVTSADINPIDHQGGNLLSHGDVEVEIGDNIQAIITSAIRAADKDFFAKYITISNQEARENYLLHGLEFSDDYTPPKR